MQICSYNSQILLNLKYCLETYIFMLLLPVIHIVLSSRTKSRFFYSLYVTFMHSRAVRFASCVSVDGPLIPDCSVPLRVSQLTKLSTVDSPLQIRRHHH